LAKADETNRSTHIFKFFSTEKINDNVEWKLLNTTENYPCNFSISTTGLNAEGRIIQQG